MGAHVDALTALAGQGSPLPDGIVEALPEAWATALGLIAAAGLWGIAGAAAGLALALVAAPVAAWWTRGGWAAGCAWAVLLAIGLGAGGLYAGAVYGVASRSERLVQEEWLLERLAVTTLLAVAEERGLDEGGALTISPTIAAAREQVETRMAAGAYPGASLLGLRLPELAGSVLDALEGIDGLTAADLRGLRLGAGGDATPGQPWLERPTPERDLLASTAPIRRHAVATIWAAALPHLVVAGAFAGATVALILLIGMISRLLGRRREAAA